jgi:flagellar export protein FliJ
MNSKRRFGLNRLMVRAQIREDSATRDAAEKQREEAAREERYLVQLDEFREKRKRETQPVDGASILSRQQLMAAQVRALDEADTKRREASQEYLAARQSLNAAVRERRMLERLDERDRAALAVLASKAAQRAIDELAAQRGPA